MSNHDDFSGEMFWTLSDRPPSIAAVAAQESQFQTCTSESWTSWRFPVELNSQGSEEFDGCTPLADLNELLIDQSTRHDVVAAVIFQRRTDLGGTGMQLASFFQQPFLNESGPGRHTY